MNRWTSSLFIALAALFISTASAQTEDFKPNIRQFPKDAKRGELVVLTAPEIAMDSKADRLSPAVRIRDANNNLVLSGTLTNQRLVVNYVRDNTGLVHNVWVLNAEEIKQKMPGQPEGILSNIRSMFETPVVKDDGNTPYNQLPKYK
ncbi:MAG: hypothetical protein WBK51_11135 [Polaromonas sp.]